MRLRMAPSFGLAWLALAAGACRQPATLSVQEGRALYQANGCASCHGRQGHGDGPVGRTLDPSPRDFRDRGAFKNGRDLDAIAHTLAVGLSRDGGKMPQFNHLTERERRALALFVTSLQDDSKERTTP
jgi:mono/diheme cytochrome c family protein